MSRLVLLVRMAARDLRRRAVETVLLLAALTVAATTLTIGLLLHGQTAAPYAETRARTAGPDVVATLVPPSGATLDDADRAALASLTSRPEVAAASPALPTTWAALTTGGLSGVAEVQGRSAAASPVDRPHLVAGHWVSGGIVVEGAFARALGVSVGDTVRLGGHPARVAGIAVSAALPPYPQLCTVGCILDHPDWQDQQPGLVWTTTAQALALATPREPIVLFQFLRLDDPASGPAFAARYSDDGPPSGRPYLVPWQDVAGRQAETLAHERAVVVFGSTLLVILALATLVVLVGGRMADEVRRVGMLKAAGASPGFVARLLLTSYLAVGLAASALGLAVGRLLAPRLVAPSAGLLGRLGGTSLSVRDGLLVVAADLGIVLLASIVPAWRAARTSTVRALADGGRSPRRRPVVLALSARLPASALLGVRLATRRPRRAVLSSASIAVAVCGSVTALYAQASLGGERAGRGTPVDPQVAQLHTVMLAVTLLLGVMAAINLAFVTRADVNDARRLLAVARTLGATPTETAVGLGIAQLLPAVAGLGLGSIAGSLVFRALSSHPVAPPVAGWVGVGVLTVVVVVALTAVPARLEARRPIAATLRAP